MTLKNAFFLALIPLMGLIACSQSEAGSGTETTPDATITELADAPEANVAPTTVSWKAMEHDFGEIAQNEAVTITFEVTNTGEEPLNIIKAKPGCGCTVAEWTQTPIAPGKSGTVTAGYDAKKPGVFNKSITVQSNATEAMQVLRIKGEVLEAK